MSRTNLVFQQRGEALGETQPVDKPEVPRRGLWVPQRVPDVAPDRRRIGGQGGVRHERTKRLCKIVYGRRHAGADIGAAGEYPRQRCGEDVGARDIPDVDKITRLRAIAEYGGGLPSHEFRDESGDDPRVGGMRVLPGPVHIEVPLAPHNRPEGSRAATQKGLGGDFGGSVGAYGVKRVILLDRPRPAVPVYGCRRGEYDASNLVAARRLRNQVRRKDVQAEVELGVPDALLDADQCCEVDECGGPDVSRDLVETLPLGDVRLNEAERRVLPGVFQVLDAPGPEIVDADHRMSRCKQLVASVAADEARRAGDDDRGHPREECDEARFRQGGILVRILREMARADPALRCLGLRFRPSSGPVRTKTEGGPMRRLCNKLAAFRGGSAL